jgi:hypothetical protein
MARSRCSELASLAPIKTRNSPESVPLPPRFCGRAQITVMKERVLLERGVSFKLLVAPVDDHGYFSGLHQIARDGQILLVRFRDNKDELPAHKR